MSESTHTPSGGAPVVTEAVIVGAGPCGLFQVFELGLLGIIWTERDHDLACVRRLHGWVSALGKWSMLDVFVVAILIVTMKAAGLARIQIGIGLYLFTLSVVATQLASAWIDRVLRR